MERNETRGVSDLIKEENNQNLLKSIPEKVKALMNSTDMSMWLLTVSVKLVVQLFMS